MVTVALDLTDALDPTLLRLGLPGSPAVVRQTGVNVDVVSKFVASVHGLTLSIKVGDGITGTVRVDFGFEVDLYKRIARELFLEALDQHGVAIPGMSGWETTYGDRSMTLTGGVYDKRDLQRILSLFSFPGPVDEDEPKVNPGEVSVPATKRYMAAVDVILGDLRKAKDTPDYAKTATWNEKAAAQLDQAQSSASEVDPIAVTAAYDTPAKRLRASARRQPPRGCRSTSTRWGARRASPFSRASGSRRAAGWGCGRPRSSRWIQTTRKSGPNSRRLSTTTRSWRVDVWIQIDERLADARQKLTDKHKTRF